MRAITHLKYEEVKYSIKCVLHL